MEIKTIEGEIIKFETVSETSISVFDRKLEEVINRMQRAQLKVSIDYKPIVKERYNTDEIHYTAFVCGRLK